MSTIDVLEAGKPGISDQAWWAERLSKPRPYAGPPLLRPRSSVYSRKSRTISLPVPEELSRHWPGGTQASAEDVHQVCVAGLAGVLYRYASAREPESICIGGPRPTRGVAPEAGEWDALPLIVEVAEGLPFRDLLEAASSSIDEAYLHPELALPQLLSSLGLKEVQNRDPLFSTALRVAALHHELSGRHDVTLTVATSADAWSLDLEYNENVHTSAMVGRLGQHLLAFLLAGLREPGLTVGDIDYLSSDEMAELTVSWAGGDVAFADDRGLHTLVEEEVERRPDEEAVLWEGETISFRELNSRANQLAHHLMRHGVTRGSRVGLGVPASASLLIGALAILKTGATVIPLVPSFPMIRNTMTIEDSGMELAVTVADLLERLPGSLATLCMDLRAAEIAAEPADNPQVATAGSDLAYVLFTSGSTGRPKGVEMEHRTLVNLVLWQGERSPQAGRRTLQRTSIGFDVSFQEIFSTWAFGGALVVAPDEVRDDVSMLPGFIADHGIARVFLPPIALEQLASAALSQSHRLDRLEEVIVAGEQLKISMLTRRFFHDVGCLLENQYGPTETHVATAHRLEGPSTRWPTAPPIGMPVRNVRVYVLDDRRRPVPVGVAGEICIGGVGPARGYTGDAFSATRFVPDPHSGLPGARLYLSGDQGRFLQDGIIEFLGRADDQVKIRGYRIELGEIEANLLQMPGVREAVARVWESDALGKQLAAYVVTERDGSPEATAIREFLLERLPGHMVPAPSLIVHLPSLPMTPTGKANRAALPRPDLSSRGPSASTAAEGSTEVSVAAIWSKALGIESIGRDDDFLALGGHSLIGIQIVSQLNEIFSVTVPLRYLLRGTTVAALAARIDQLRDDVAAAAPSNDGVDERPVAPDTFSEAELEELELPTGSIVCLHRAETRYLHLDVFERRTYDSGEVTIPDQGCVLDVGAHIGLFTLYALERARGDLRVHAFEPCPPLFQALQRNTAGRSNVTLHRFALSNVRDTASLTFYPNLTGMSSFHPDQSQERALLSGILGNIRSLGEDPHIEWLAQSNEYMAERLRSSTFTCERRTLSDFIDEAGIESVELLKVDVQKSELEVLEGVRTEHWSRIRQVVVEAHDLDGRLQQVATLLRGHGFRVTVRQDALHAGTVVHFVDAVRASTPAQN